MKKNLNAILAVLLTLVLVFGNTLSVLAHQQYKNEGSLPAEVRHMPRLKVAPAESGTFTDGLLTVILTLQDDNLTADWETTDGSVPVMYVFVFGGNEGNLYDYSPNGAHSDTGLVTPLGKKANHVTFYYKTEQQTSMLTVKHLEQGTNAELAPEETHVQVVGTSLTVGAINIEGYTPVGTTSFDHTFGADNAELIFYYAPIGTTLTVKHMIQNTSEEIAARQYFSGTYADKVTVYAATDLAGYIAIEPSHTHTFGTTDAEHIFYYTPVQAALTVKYVVEDSDPEQVLNQNSYHGLAGQVVRVEVLPTIIKGGLHFALVPGQEHTESFDHTLEAGNSVKTFYYAPVTGEDLTVRYVVQGSAPELLLGQEVHSEQLGTTKSYDIPGILTDEETGLVYKLALEETQTNPYVYTFTVESHTETFYYAPVEAGLTVKYVVQGSEPELLLGQGDYPGQAGQVVHVSLPPELIKDGLHYGLVPDQEPGESFNHRLQAGHHILTFYYQALTSKLTVKHVVYGTDTELTPSKDYEGIVGSTLTVNAQSFSGYRLRSGTGSTYTHTFETEDGTWVFEYTRVTEPPPVTYQYTLTVRYILDGTDIELQDHASHTVDEGHSVTATAPAIPGYVLKKGEKSSVTYTLYSNREHVFLYQEDIPLTPPEDPPVEEPPVEEPPVEEPPLPPILPVTGSIDASALYAAGILLAVAGFSTRRKKNRS